MRKYFTIGEIAKLYHIGQDSLRYYEELNLLHPKRGKNNYREYELDEIWRLNVIRELRELGFSMERIGMYLENHNVESTKDLLLREQEMIQEKIKKLKKMEKDVAGRIEMLEGCEKVVLQEVEEKQMPLRMCRKIEEGYTKDVEMDVLIKQLLNMNPENLCVIGSNSIGSFLPLEELEKGNHRSYAGVLVLDEEGDLEIEEGTYLSISYQGNCEQNYEYIPHLLAYAKEHNLKLVGDLYEFLWIDIHVSSREEEHLTELQVRVEK